MLRKMCIFGKMNEGKKKEEEMAKIGQRTEPDKLCQFYVQIVGVKFEEGRWLNCCGQGRVRCEGIIRDDLCSNFAIVILEGDLLFFEFFRSV